MINSYEAEILTLLDKKYKLIAEKTWCLGTGHNNKNQLHLFQCARACQDIKSMFIFSRQDSGTCFGKLCHCYCENDSDRGRCTKGTGTHKWFDLYALGKLPNLNRR